MFTQGSAEILFYTSNTTGGFMSSQGAGMYTQVLECTQGAWWNPFCLSTHEFLSLRAWLLCTSTYLPGTMRGLLIPSWGAPFPAPQILMPNHLVPWACRQHAKVSLMDKFAKGQLSLKSTQIFLYRPYAEASNRNALFFPLTKEEYTQMVPWGQH